MLVGVSWSSRGAAAARHGADAPGGVFPRWARTSHSTRSAPPCRRQHHLPVHQRLLLALAMQQWNLHRRIALLTVKVMGTKPSRPSSPGSWWPRGFLSMWVSNTATAVMMCADRRVPCCCW
ncbi:anion permease [Kocuria rhizophila]|nr:anion permease [Kocuria rhizophila]